MCVFFFKHKTAYEVHISDWSSDVCSSDLELARLGVKRPLYVTDKGVVAAGVLAQAIEAMPATDNFTVFDDTPVNPTEAAALAGAERFRDGARSEARRVGKECGRTFRSRWSPYCSQQKHHKRINYDI